MEALQGDSLRTMDEPLLEPNGSRQGGRKTIHTVMAAVFFATLVMVMSGWQAPGSKVATSAYSANGPINVAEEAMRPNFLFLLVDDWGYGDVDACPDNVPYAECALRIPPGDRDRAQHLRTPRIKQMAEEGMIFTNWYAPRSICSPSREALLTGRDPVRFGGIDQHLRIFLTSGSRGGLPTTEKSVAQYLKNQGYSTGYSGKWHTGLTNGTDAWAYAAWRFGFDEVEFFVEGSNGEPCHNGSYNPPGDDNVYHMCTFSHVTRRKPGSDDGEVLEQPIRWENITSRQLHVTLEFIRRHQNEGKPWFFQHAFTGVHIPWVPSRYFVSSPRDRHWLDMVGEVDWATGVLLDELEKTGQEKNTVVVITSDNGPYLEFASTYCPQNCRIQTPSWQRSGKDPLIGCSICSDGSVSSPGPLSGGKGQVWEGGVRVPAIWRWPGKIPAGTINPLVTSSMDFLPTALALAGGAPDPQRTLDGCDISASLLQRPSSATRPQGTFTYWCGATLMGVRFGDIKVMWWTQKWVGKNADQPMDSAKCGGTGKCCDGSPSRLCTCGGLGWNKYVQKHSPPLVINLTSNPGEDVKLAIEADYGHSLIRKASAMRKEKLVSVAADRGINSFFTFLPAALLQKRIQALENLMQVDIFLPIPESLQLPQFRPYDKCSVDTVHKKDPRCVERFPCLEQSDYAGPHEYILPSGKRCGGWKHANSSYFPDYLLSSVRAWQKLANLPELCLAGDDGRDSMNRCKDVAEHGLNNIPTGSIWNEPYAETAK